MTENVTLDIVNLCLSIDKKAAETYNTISKFTKRDDFKAFWKHRAEEEEAHVVYWQRLLNFARNTSLPQVFEEPHKVREDLESIVSKIDNLLFRTRHFPTAHNSLLLAYRLEFYATHPAFRTLFHLMKTLTGEKTPEDDYEHHINQFIEAIGKYGEADPELEIVGDAIRRLWRENKELYVQSNMDELTGIFNRRGFSNAVRPLANLAQRNKFNVGMLMLDIDHFKSVNDRFGHQRGDGILKRVAGILKSRLRSSDIVGRYGGEEFVVYFPSVKDDSLDNIANDLRQRVESECKHDVPVTISIGASQGVLSEKEDVGKWLDRLIKRADDCLYQAKNTGRNKVIISN